MTSDPKAAIRHSITRIESSLDRVAPRLRGGLEEVLTGLRHRLDALPPVGQSVGEAASKGAHKAEAAAQVATGRLAEAAEHLADAVSRAPVPATRKAIRAGQKAIADTAHTASKELRRASGGTRTGSGALSGAILLAAAAAATFLARRAFQRYRRT
jgi:hypothetical protein